MLTSAKSKLLFPSNDLCREHRNLRLARPRGAANKDQMFAQLRFWLRPAKKWGLCGCEIPSLCGWKVSLKNVQVRSKWNGLPGLGGGGVRALILCPPPTPPLTELRKTCMPRYQPIIPPCLVKLKRGLNPDLTGVIKLIFFFSKKDLGCWTQASLSS